MSPSDAQIAESLRPCQGSRDAAGFYWRDLQPSYLTNLSYTAYNEVML